MNKKIVFRLVLTTFFWGLNFHLAKSLLGPLSFDQVAFGRYAVASLFFLFATPVSIQQLRQLGRSAGAALLAVALLGIFGYTVLLFIALPYTSAVNAALIMALSPALTVVFSRLLLKTEVTPYQFVGLLLGLGGVLLVISKGQWGTLRSLTFSLGDLLLLLDCSLFALANVLNKKFLSHTDSRVSAALTTHITTLLCLALVWWQAAPVTAAALAPKTVVALIGLGAFGSFLAHRFWYGSIAQAGAAVSSYFLNLVPLFTTLIAVFTGVAVSPYQVAGGALIVSGIIVSLYKKTVHATDKVVLVGCKA